MKMPQVFEPLVTPVFGSYDIVSTYGVMMTSCTIRGDALEVDAEMSSPFNASIILQSAPYYMDHYDKKEFHSVPMYYNIKIHGGNIEKFVVNKGTGARSFFERAYYLGLINNKDKFFALYTPVPSDEVIQNIYRKIDPTPACSYHYVYNSGSYPRDYAGAVQSTIIGAVFLSNNFNKELYKKQKHKVRRSCIFN